MIGRIDLVRGPASVLRALSVSVLGLVMGCGSDKATLIIANEQGSGADEITQVLTRACLARHWDPSAPALDAIRDLPPGGRVTIPHGESHEFELAPGCHDFVVTRNGKTARARVMLDIGDSATWVPFQIEENDSWWCYGDCDE